MSNWDDDFDFEDADTPSKKKQSTKKRVVDEDFLEYDDSKKKLPSINQRGQSGKSNAQKNKSGRKFNPYTQQLKNKKNKGYDADDFEEQEIPSITISNKGNRNSVVKKTSRNDYDQDQFYEEVAEDNIKPAAIQNHGSLPSKPADDDDYGEDFEEDNYGEDFQEVQSPIKKRESVVERPKAVMSVKLPMKNPKTDNNQNFSLNSLSKQKSTVTKTPLRRLQSRKNMKSVDQKRHTGASKAMVSSLFIPNKYATIVDKTFPDLDTNQQHPDKIIKTNQRIRGMIKRLNEQLNDLISKNMLQMKVKHKGKNETVQDRVKILDEERKNSEAAIERMNYELGKLQGRQGELKEEEFYIMMERNIDEVKANIKETEKEIIRLKFQVSISGKKLAMKEEDKRNTQELHHLNINLIQVKKDDQKGEERIKKLDEKMEELNRKIPQVQEDLRHKIEDAKAKGIHIENRDELIRRYEETKKKSQNTRNYKLKTENLMKTKAEIISHENDQIRISINNSEAQIKNVYGSIVHSQTESAKTVQKAKQNTNNAPPLIVVMQEILKSLEQKNEFDPNFEFQSAKIAFKPIKNSLIGIDHDKNQDKSHPNKTSEAKHVIPSLPGKGEDQNNKKPNLLKKKNELDLTDNKNENYQRLWKEEEQSKNEQKHDSIPNKEIIPQEKTEEVKKKPFSLKKNREQVRPPSNDTKLDLRDEKKDDPIKEEANNDQPTVAPRMMKFKKNINKEASEQVKETPVQQIQTKEPAEEIKQEKKEQPSDQPVVAPRRFNLRNRAEKKDQYNPTAVVEKKEPEKKAEEYKPNMNFNDEYKPNLNFNAEDDNKKADIQPKIPNKEIDDKQGEVAKPTFNLRLRDRRKNQQKEGNDEYKPPGLAHQDASKKEVNPYAPKQQEVNPYAPKQQEKNPYNPYAPQEGAARPRQGRVKKQKVANNQPKQKYNIYDQAEDLSGGNQFVNEPKASANGNENRTEDMSLNDMLGINKNKNRADDDDMFIGNNNQYAPKKNKKKPDDFFMDM